MKDFIKGFKGSMCVILAFIFSMIGVAIMLSGTAFLLDNGYWYLSPISAIFIPAIFFTFVSRLLLGNWRGEWGA